MLCVSPVDESTVTHTQIEGHQCQMAPGKGLAAGVTGAGSTKVRRCTSHLFVSECEFVLSLLQRSVVHPLFDQAFWACNTLRGGRLVGPLRLRLLTKIIRRRGRLVPASQ